MASSIIAKRISVTSTENTLALGDFVQDIHLKNIGAADCFIGFDLAIDTNISYVLEAGEALNIDEARIRRLHFKTSSGTTTLHLLKMYL